LSRDHLWHKHFHWRRVSEYILSSSTEGKERRSLVIATLLVNNTRANTPFRRQRRETLGTRLSHELIMASGIARGRVSTRTITCAGLCSIRLKISLWTIVPYILETAGIMQHWSYRQNSTSNSDKAGSLATARGYETHKVCHSKNENTLLPLPPNRYF